MSGANPEMPDPIAPDRPPSGKFDRVAAVYEPLAGLYSLGQIGKAKASQWNFMQPGDRVLYVGVGAGEDALGAARRGVQLTAIDLSAGLLHKARGKLEDEQLQAEWILGDAREHDRPGTYDIVTANFFLNCFSKGDMRRMLKHLARQLRPGGRLMVADVAVPMGHPITQAIHRTYNAVGIGLYWAMGLVPLHPIYDYRLYFPEANLELESTQNFKVIPFGPVSFQSLVARRSEASQEM